MLLEKQVFKMNKKKSERVTFGFFLGVESGLHDYPTKIGLMNQHLLWTVVRRLLTG